MKQGSGVGGRRTRLRPLALAVALACVAPAAFAGGTITFGDDQSVSVGLGLRTSYTSAEKAAPDGTSRSSDFSLDSIRLYMNASLNKYIKGTFNTEKDANDKVMVLDAIARFEPSDAFNIWFGRMLPPSDRANLDGPYYLNAWSYPGLVSQYPAKFAGRNDGATVWGKLLDKKLVYSVGAFNGHNVIAGASSEADNLMYAARVQYDFWDAEPNPAYYSSSTYYGGADVLAIALAGMHQSDGVGTSTAKGDYSSYSVDGLMEKKLAAGVVTLEGAYYRYNTGGVVDVAPSFGGATSTSNVGGLVQGKAYLAGAAFMFPQVVGVGKLQPYVRYQKWNPDDFAGVPDQKQYDAGLNYIIDGHNARVSATFTRNTTANAADTHKFVVGLQLQF